MASLSGDDFSCPVCHEIFSDPVVLSCSHSACKECLQQFWRTKETRECPVCRRLSSHDPPCNLVLKNLCETFQKQTIGSRSSGSEEICSLHGEKLKLFCLEDKQPVFLVCRDSKKHIRHTFRPISEETPTYRAQAEHTERQIKHQFEKLHQFLRDEEEATITALREEEEQKKQMMKEKLEEMNTHISALSHTIRDMEEMLKDNDVCFLKKFPGSMERVQISQPHPQTPHGALIHVPRYLGNLSFRVWEEMRDIVSYTPVILDPNTANPYFLLSDDLTRVRNTEDKQPLPDNPERFDCYFVVLGSEGFNSGSHCWDVEVKGNTFWCLGVTTASNQRKGKGFSNSDFWCVTYGGSVSPLNDYLVTQSLDRVRVDLDCDRGTVSFSDPLTHTQIHKFKTIFTDTIFPFFSCNYPESLRILPINSQ